jgi:hypothetical protein
MDVPVSGGVVQASASTAHCSTDGSLTALQQMLSDLGYYKGPIGGTQTLQTVIDVATAMKAFADANHVTDPTTLCGAIMDAWQQKRAARNWFIAGTLLVAGALYWAWHSRSW